MKAWIFSWAMLQILIFASCGFGAPVSVDEFDRRCEADSDCVLVNGYCSASCDCGSGALAESSAESFMSRVDAVCFAAPAPQGSCNCAERSATCVEGQCEITWCDSVTGDCEFSESI